jgi:integrase
MAHRRGKRWIATGYDRATKAKRHIGTFDTKKEATNAEAHWKLRTRPTGRETCDAFAERWPTDYPRPRTSTNLHNAERVRRFAKDFKGIRLTDLDRPAARAWALKHPSDVAAVRAMFGDAVRDGLVERNSFSELRLPQSRGRKDITALTEAELLALADVVLDPRMELGDFAAEYRAMVLWAGYVGTRPGETFMVGRDDIRGEHVTIERAYSSRSREITLPKNGQPRTVIVPPNALIAVEGVPRHASGLLFESPTGRQWTASLHQVYWNRLRLLANRPGFDFYELRHAAATMLLERGVGEWDVAIQLGHTDGGQLVRELYGHPSHAGARARLLAAWDAEVKPLRAVPDAGRAAR